MTSERGSVAQCIFLFVSVLFLQVICVVLYVMHERYL